MIFIGVINYVPQHLTYSHFLPFAFPHITIFVAIIIFILPSTYIMPISYIMKYCKIFIEV